MPGAEFHLTAVAVQQRAVPAEHQQAGRLSTAVAGSPAIVRPPWRWPGPSPAPAGSPPRAAPVTSNTPRIRPECGSWMGTAVQLHG